MRRWLRRLAIASGAAVLSLLLLPVETTTTRLLLLLSMGCGWASVAALAWLGRWRLRLLLAGLPLLGVVLMLPGRSSDPERLRVADVAALRRWMGTTYLWGGEGRLGIDCSGLVRRGFRDALVRESARTANPAPMRAALSLWWHDSSARAIGDAYRGLTRPVTSSTSINALDPGVLRPGDLAVTATGVHVLAYLGEGAWIEADPTQHAVVTMQAPDPAHVWFTVPVKVVRWTVLAEPP